MSTLPSSLAKSDITEPASRRALACALDLRLYRADALLAGEVSEDLEPEEQRALTEIANWLDGFVSKPHPALGRSGEVCPWTRRTLDLGKLLLTPISSTDPVAADAIVLALLEQFASTEPTDGMDSSFRSIVAVFHRLDPAVTESFIVGLHARLKPAFLGRGLMLGEFYQTCEKPGLRNTLFRPLRSPLPLLVIRSMVEVDIEFLIDQNEFVEAYLKIHGGRGAERLGRILRERPDSVAPERVPSLFAMISEYREVASAPRIARPTSL
jgi:hypothetical protein